MTSHSSLTLLPTPKHPTRRARHPYPWTLILGLVCSASCGEVIVLDEASDPESFDETADPAEPAPASGSAADFADVACRGQTATRLQDGRLLLVGACTIDKRPVGSLILDPLGGRAQPLPIPSTRVGHCTVAKNDGTILVIGGVEAGSEPDFARSYGQPLASTLALAPGATHWVDGPLMRTPRAWAACIELSSGEVLAAGGLTTHYGAPSASITNRVERLPSGAADWIAEVPMMRARYRHQLVATASGDLLVGGGLEAQRMDQPMAEVRRKERGDWEPIATPRPLGGTGSAGLLVDDEAGPLLFQDGWVTMFDGSRFAAARPYGAFWPFAAANTLDGGKLTVGLGYWGGLSGAHRVDAADWAAVTVPQVASATTSWPVTLTALQDAVVIVGEQGWSTVAFDAVQR